MLIGVTIHQLCYVGPSGRWRQAACRFLCLHFLLNDKFDVRRQQKVPDVTCDNYKQTCQKTHYEPALRLEIYTHSASRVNPWRDGRGLKAYEGVNGAEWAGDYTNKKVAEDVWAGLLWLEG